MLVHTLCLLSWGLNHPISYCWNVFFLLIKGWWKYTFVGCLFFFNFLTWHIILCSLTKVNSGLRLAERPGLLTWSRVGQTIALEPNPAHRLLSPLKFYWNIATPICTTRAELSSCKRPNGSQSLKRLLSVPLQKKPADPCSKGYRRKVA